MSSISPGSPDWMQGPQWRESSPLSESLDAKGIGGPENPAYYAWTFIEALSRYYSLFENDPAKKEKMDHFCRELSQVYDDYASGRITVDQAFKRLDDIRKEPGYPQVDNPTYVSAFLAMRNYELSTYWGNRIDAEKVAKQIRQLQEDLKNGKIDPVVAARMAQDIYYEFAKGR